MRISKDAWVLVFVFIVLVVGGIYIAQPPAPIDTGISTTYSPTGSGVKAFYTLLGERLGYNIDRLMNPYTQLSSKTAVLVVVQPLAKYEIKPGEKIALKNWIANGGTAIFVSNDLANVPAAFGSNQKIGKGYVYAFNSRKAITNAGMHNYKNAITFLDIINKHANKSNLILFDEYHHGITEQNDKSIFAMISRESKIAIVILAVAGLILCHTKGRRFGAIRNLPKSETVRPGYVFVESIAGLYQRAHASDLAANILCKSFKQNLCSRLGLPSDAARNSITSYVASDFGNEIAQRVGKVIANCEHWHAGDKPGDSELLSIAVEIRKLEEELNLARNDA